MMSIKTIRIDDLEEGEVLAEETVLFGLDGQNREIDLSTKNATKLRNVMAPFVAASRPAGGTVTRKPVTGTSSSQRSADRDQKMAIREWANSQGIRVSHKGRLPQEVVDRFNSAHTHPVKPVEQPEFSGV
jgi:Lsr2